MKKKILKIKKPSSHSIAENMIPRTSAAKPGNKLLKIKKPGSESQPPTFADTIKYCPLVGGLYDGSNVNVNESRNMIEYNNPGSAYTTKYYQVKLEDNTGAFIKFYKHEGLSDLDAMQLILDKYVNK